jgi:hypothetical protein
MATLAADVKDKTQITIKRGATTPIELHLSDGDGTYRDITGQTGVRVQIEQKGAVLLARDSDSDNAAKIYVTDNPAIVYVYPTQTEADAFLLGDAKADVWVQLPNADVATRGPAAFELPSRSIDVFVTEGQAEPE